MTPDTSTPDTSTLDTRAHVEAKARRAQAAAAQLRTTSSAIKDAALLAMAAALEANQERIFEANARDMEAGRARGLTEAMLGRLKLDAKGVRAMAEGCRQVAALPDPVGAVVAGWTRPNGLKIEQVRVPLGVVAIIYESRPNVTVDAAILCLKAGNAAILRGGSEALHSNLALTQIINDAAAQAGAPPDCIQLIETTDRAAATHLARLNGLVDLIVPRGGAGLKKALMEVATVPVIYAAGGICHTFVDAGADLDNAAAIVVNAKVQKPSACNALETLLVHRQAAEQFLPLVSHRLTELGVELHGDERARQIVPAMTPATDDDWDEEHLALILGVRVVDGVDEAIAHIARHGNGHSEAILTQNLAHAEKFCNELDAAAVYVNASTRFTDGFEFGLGAEIGISTQKLHARGPMGLEALTSTKYIVRGSGQVRA
jgi:glutamate-5-semialdehyde dehydrogenase